MITSTDLLRHLRRCEGVLDFRALVEAQVKRAEPDDPLKARGESMLSADIPVREFMTEAPHGIEPHETLSVARRRMQDLKIRHLPVRAGGRVVGT